MNIDKYKHQHGDIVQGIETLRAYAKAGIAGHAAEIAKTVVAMSSIIKMHLTIEDKFLYPAVKGSGDAALAGMATAFQQEMVDIAAAYAEFARRWNHAPNVAGSPERFRDDANRVLKVLHLRMVRENNEFYPLIEAA